ncbi:MAG: hypothetical protein CMO44_18495 [Verrucomicrobiales bacterium]|nr:hypothetical protein [Verrucomicrobiales bacterium]
MKPTTASKRKVFCLQKLTEYYSGTSYCSCFVAPWLCPEPSVRVWQPQEPKNTAIVKAVNVWIELLQKCDNVFIQKILYEWIDLNHLKIVHLDYKNLPTLNMVSFENKQITDNFIAQIIMDILPPCKQSKDKSKILHLLSKACPKRCQIRNLKEIVLQYATDDDETYHFLLEVMKKSLFGTYSHCKEMLCFEGRHVFYSMFVYQMSNKSFFLKWFSNNNHQIFIFFCLKEFLCDAIWQVKSVYNFIEKKWKWSVFEKQVVQSMDSARKILNTIAKREHKLLHRGDWILSVESFLQQVSKQHIKLFRTSNAISFYSKTKTLLNKYIVSENANMPVNHCIGCFLWSFMQRTKDEKIIFSLLRHFSIPQDIINHLMNERFTQVHFSSLTCKQLFVLKEFCRLMDLRKGTSIFILPQHLYEKQRAALLLKESLCLDPPQSLGYICFVCNDIKFFLTKVSNSSRHSNRLARGSLRVVVDNNSESLKLVCGRKPERHVKNSKKKWKDDQKAISRKMFKEKQRNFLSKQCIDTPLQEIDLLGHSLQFNNKMITLCTTCANVCLIEANSLSYSTEINCKVCHMTKKDVCIKCQAETACNRILVYNTKKPLLHKAPMCNSCTTIYAQKQPVMI